MTPGAVVFYRVSINTGLALIECFIHTYKAF